MRSVADSEVRRLLRVAQNATVRAMRALEAEDAVRAVELADEALECLDRAESSFFAAASPRSTAAVEAAVRAARERARS